MSTDIFTYKNLPPLADTVLQSFLGSFIGGSYVVDPKTANDVDIVINELVFSDLLATSLGFYTLKAGDSKYDNIDFERLKNVYEGHDRGVKINLLVIGAIFWPAYMGAINQMQMNPDQYRSREERIAIHKRYCSMVRDIAKGNA